MVHIADFLRDNHIKMESYLDNISNLNILNPIDL